jgi:hypothetical protein
MHGRLIRTEVRALPFGEAALFFPGDDGITAFERCAIAGGMPLYLRLIASGQVRTAVCQAILDRAGLLWNEGRSILEQELREPRVYFGILEQLASGEKELNEIAQALRMEGASVGKYLTTLAGLRLIDRKLPVGSPPTARGGHWRLLDPFLRFWFRFVFPYQDSLESGLRPGDLYDGSASRTPLSPSANTGADGLANIVAAVTADNDQISQTFADATRAAYLPPRRGDHSCYRRCRRPARCDANASRPLPSGHSRPRDEQPGSSVLVGRRRWARG